MRNLIFDAVGEAVIKVVAEDTFSITSGLRSNPIELHDVLIDLLPVFHGEVVKLVFSISDGLYGQKLVWNSRTNSLKLSCQSGRRARSSVGCTRKTQSFRESVLSNWSGSQTLVWGG